jgi:tRNA-Thr(GGU) m(6)t(6)A37 methyltransferase TsaA
MMFKEIGKVRSKVKEAVDENWGKTESEIVLGDEYAPGLTGLEGFTHIIVVFHMHKADYNNNLHLVRHPQERADLPKLGIFAQRAKHRPNPIGITAVELVAVSGNSVKVRGLDAIDGTPVLDIKPYFPAFDSRPNARIPTWVEEIMRPYF